MNLYFKIIGYFATIMLSILMFPQIYATYKTKNVEGLSIWFLIFQLITSILWILYGIGFIIANINDGIPIIIANVFILLSTIILIVMKNKYK
jgi:uncharacterized protein with PQ loop repeat